MAEDYFAAMERVEKRLEIVPEGQKSTKNEPNVKKVQGQNYLKMLAEQLAKPQITFEERLELVGQLRKALA